MIALYRALLHLYPASFRREYGAEMTAIFADRAADAGLLGRVALLLGAIPEVAWNAMHVHGALLGQDLRYTVRTMRKAPGFALTAILVTALGVGANVAAFSVADFVLFRPLPFPEPDRLVRLCEGPRTGPVGWGCMNELSPANYRDFKEQTSSFEALGAFRTDAVNLVGGGEPARLTSSPVTTDVMPLLGVQPVLGRMIAPRADEAGARDVVISYGLWQARFGGERTVLGRTLNLDGAPYTVIGVMPATFHFPGRDVQLWTPLHFDEDDFQDRNNSYLHAVGRLRRGVTFEQARADLDVVVDRLARTYPENEETGVSFFGMRDSFSPRYRLMLQALCGASICILILACANLGSLLLARAGARGRELAVRAALGAGRERLVRQLITESTALALIGGLAGVLVAIAAFPLLALLIPAALPIGTEPALNLRVLAWAALFTGLTALGFGVLPALHTGRNAALEALRGGRASARKQRFRAVLVAIEVAASVVLLVSSGLLIRALLRVQAIDPGFRTENVLTLRTVLPKPKYAATEKREQFYGAVLAEVRRLPGVQSAAYTSGLPMIMYGGISRAILPGAEVRRDGDYAISRRYITPQYFRTMGIPLRAGRDFADADARSFRNVAIVSESFVQRYWPDEDPLGKQFLYQDSLKTVIGVVGDVRVRGLERSSEPQVYLPTATVFDSPLTFYDPKDLVIRASGSPTALMPNIREIIRRVDPEQPISDVMPLGDVLEMQTETRAAQVRVLLALALVALLLAGVGIHGVLGYMVAQQRQEIGVRLALGAEPRRIIRRVVRGGVAIVMLGMLPGLYVAFAAGRAMSALLFGVPPLDAVTVVATVALCLAMSITGALLPALRAARVSPMIVMRAE